MAYKHTHECPRCNDSQLCICPNCSDRYAMALCASCPSPAPIPVIDRGITAISRQMRRLETIDLLSAESWQAAWDKHPDLHQQFDALYLERGIAQLLR